MSRFTLIDGTFCVFGDGYRGAMGQGGGSERDVFATIKARSIAAIVVDANGGSMLGRCCGLFGVVHSG